MSPAPSGPQTRSILEDLPFCFARASLSFRRFNDQTLHAAGSESLAPGLASVLHAVEELGDCTVNQLVERTHLPNGTLTGLLDTLERDGRIQRTRNPEDGRSRLIGLTRNGHELCAKLHIRHRAVMRIYGEALSETEMAELTRLLGKVTACMRSHAASENGETPKSTRRPRPTASRGG